MSNTTTTADVKEDMIKVRLDGESVWAVQLSPDTAEIRNTPLDDRVNFMDIVRISEDRRFLKVIERRYEKGLIQYQYDKNTIEEEYPKLAQYLRDNDIIIEGFVPGMAGIDFKKELSREKLQEILNAAPMKILGVEFH